MSAKVPVILPIETLDADEFNIIQFVVPSGGDRPNANTLTIRRQSDSKIIYKERQVTYKYIHKLPAHSLVNGEYYNAEIEIHTENGTFAKSRPVAFRTYSSPRITITNIPEDGVIGNASYEFDFVYTQAQGEPIINYVANLYNDNDELIYSADRVYLLSEETVGNRYEGQCLLSGFSDGASYGVEITAKTKSGIDITTGIQRFYTKYTQSGVRTQLKLKNNCEKGSITVSSNVILIEGISNPNPPLYIDGKEVDLTKDKTYVEWEDGYTINGDFVFRAWFRKPNDNKVIVTMKDGRENTIEITYVVGYPSIGVDKKGFAVARITRGELSAIYNSNFITPIKDSEYYCLHFMRKDNNYLMRVTKGNE